jgi:uncharacterized protein YegL
MLIPTLPDEVAKRPLQFFWLLDASSSMAGRKIASLNQAVRESLPEIAKAVTDHPEVQIQMRAIKFSNTAEWHIGPEPVDLEQFAWRELIANGVTATASAINLLVSELQVDKLPPRGYPPVCILLSDGYHTDSDEEYAAALASLKSCPWGRKAVRLVIAIGDESDYDEKALLEFVSHPEIGVLKAHTPQALVSYIRWASVAASVGASQGKSQAGADPNKNVILPSPPPVPPAASNMDVF